jgi:3-hydroxyacyl-[acyl-carrier-protein] dehydratase
MDDFRHSTILLKEARCVRYADFVRPGETLTVRADLVKNEGNLTTIKAQGWVRDVAAVSGKLVVERFNVADRDPARIAWDGYARREMRKRFALLYEPEKAE